MSSYRKGTPKGRGAPVNRTIDDPEYEDLLNPLREFPWPDQDYPGSGGSSRGPSRTDSVPIPDPEEIAEVLQSLETIYDVSESKSGESIDSSPRRNRDRFGSAREPQGRRQARAPKPARLVSRQPKQKSPSDFAGRNRLPRPPEIIEGHLDDRVSLPKPDRHDRPLALQKNIVDVKSEPVTDSRTKRGKTNKRQREGRVEDEERKRQRIKAYFGKRSKWSIVPIIVGLGFIVHPGRFDPFYGFEMAFDWALATGAAIIFLALCWRYLRIRVPKDELLDEWMADDLIRLDRHARDMMGLNRRTLLTDPVLLAGFPDIDRIGSTYMSGRYGKDSVLRFTPRALTIFAFTESGIISYEGAVDITTGSHVYEEMCEFSYEDISTVAFSRTPIRSDLRYFARLARILLPWKWAFIDRITYLFSGKSPESLLRKNSKEIFGFGLSNGREVKTVLRDGRLAGDREYDEIPNTVDEVLLKHIREFVRLKKSQTSLLADSSFLT